MRNTSRRFGPVQWIILIILIAVSLYRISFDTESFEPAQDTPTTETFTQIVFTDTPQPDTAVPATSPPATSAPITDIPLPATATNTPEILLEEPTGDFDFFVLALSWSPDYCATSGDNDPQQCSIGKKLGFVLHGLWPQYDRGWPSYCTIETWPDELEDEFSNLYPSEKLYEHEWEKHGTCTGSTPEGYMLLSKKFKETVTIPEAFQSPESPFRTDADKLKEEFVQANPEFTDTSFEVFCSGSGRFLKELFVCFSKDGSATECSDELHKSASKSCQSLDFLVRNTR